jgi:hypothetical protein
VDTFSRKKNSRHALNVLVPKIDQNSVGQTSGSNCEVGPYQSNNGPCGWCNHQAN